MKKLYVDCKNRTEWNWKRIKRTVGVLTPYQVVTVVFGVFTVWFALSLINIICNNLGICNYAAWNFIVLMIN
jgi:hypothetical protein